GEGAGRAGLDALAGEVVGTAGGDLDDAVGARLGEALQHGVDRLRRRDVDRREREARLLGGVEHRGVLVGGGDGHQGSPSTGTHTDGGGAQCPSLASPGRLSRAPYPPPGPPRSTDPEDSPWRKLTPASCSPTPTATSRWSSCGRPRPPP